MKKKLFTLMTLLLCLCSGAWASQVTYTFSSSSFSNDRISLNDYVYLSKRTAQSTVLYSDMFSIANTDDYLCANVVSGYKITSVVYTCYSGSSQISTGKKFYGSASSSYLSSSKKAKDFTCTHTLAFGNTSSVNSGGKLIGDVTLDATSVTNCVSVALGKKMGDSSSDNANFAIKTITINYEVASATTYSVTHTLTNVTATSGATGASAATAGTAYNAVFAASSGYTLPSTIDVTIGGNAATAGTDYTWNSSTGAFQVPAAKVTGAIVVTIAGVTASSAPVLNGASSSPAASATNVAVSGSGYLKFSKNLSSKTDANFTISPNNNGETLSISGIDGTDASKVNYSWSGLKRETEYTINIAAGAVSDGTSGNAATSLSFTTVAKTASECSFATSTPAISFPGTTTYTQVATTAAGYDGTVSYALSDNTCGATINNSTHEVTVTQAGSVTVTATAPATNNYTESSASYTLTVTDSRTALTGAWTPTSVSCAVGDSPAAPTFAVTGGEAVLSDDYTVAYTKVSGDNLATFTEAGGISAISTAAAGTETIKATVNLTNTTEYTIAQTEYTIEITVANTHRVTYDANGGTGTAPTDVTAYAEGESVKVADNIGSLTKSGYSVVGWNTDPAATTASQAFGSSFEMGDADVTLYAIWQENYYVFTPKTVTETEDIASNAIVSTSTGGTMKYTPSSGNNPTLQYASDGLLFGGSANSIVTIELNDYMKDGSIIIATFWSNDAKDNRGVDVLNAENQDKADWYFTGTTEGVTKVFTLTATSSNGFANTKSFKLKRKGNAYLKSLTVTNCQPGGTISASGWNTYSSNKALDLSTITGGTAYVATTTSSKSVKVEECTDIVAAGTGLMINGTPGETFTINTTADDATFSGTNLLEGLPNGGKVAANAYNYVFAWPTATPADYGFYYVNATEPTLPAGKAYLHVDGGINARLNIVFDGETTGINTIENSQLTIDNDASMYNLAGQKVSKSYKGIVIVNGKKVVRK